MSWTSLTPSPCRTHHVDGAGAPAYAPRFDEVLAFRAPGLAPVADAGQAWHIHADGTPAYARRFARTGAGLWSAVLHRVPVGTRKPGPTH